MLTTGTRVRCINSTRFHDMLGTITGVKPHSDYPYSVRWDDVKDEGAFANGGTWSEESLQVVIEKESVLRHAVTLAAHKFGEFATQASDNKDVEAYIYWTGLESIMLDALEAD